MHYEQAIANLIALKGRVPTLVGNIMVNNALDNLRQQVDTSGNPLKPRRARAPRNAGRAILTDTGRGRRSIAFSTQGYQVRLTGVDYMVAHNEGVNKTVTARSRAGRSYTRRMNLPQRRFAGPGNKLQQQLAQMFSREIIKALT